jgi:hypothetical protein
MIKTFLKSLFYNVELLKFIKIVLIILLSNNKVIETICIGCTISSYVQSKTRI